MEIKKWKSKHNWSISDDFGIWLGISRSVSIFCWGFLSVISVNFLDDPEVSAASQASERGGASSDHWKPAGQQIFFKFKKMATIVWVHHTTFSMSSIPGTTRLIVNNWIMLIIESLWMYMPQISLPEFVQFVQGKIEHLRIFNSRNGGFNRQIYQMSHFPVDPWHPCVVMIEWENPSSWNRATPSHHPFIAGIFPEIHHPSSLLGYRHVWNPPNLWLITLNHH